MKQQMKLVEWRPMRTGRLLGFVTVEVFGCLTIRECPLLRGSEGLWASLPAKPEIGRDGRCRTGTQGERRYVEMLTWRSRKLHDAFSERVVGLVRAQYPADLE
jgi:hypothetical protein